MSTPTADEVRPVDGADTLGRTDVGGRRRLRLPTAVTIALDQVVNTGSNFVAVAIVAHTLGPRVFAVFSTAQVITLVVQVAAQAGTSDQLLATPATLVGQRERIARSIRDRSVALILGSVVVLSLAQLTPWHGLALGLSVVAYLCSLIFTDFIRNLCYAYRRAATALVLDLALAVVEVAALLVWRDAHDAGAASAWQALALPYVVIALIGLLVTRKLLGDVFTRMTLAAFRWRYAAEVGGTLGILQLAQLAFVAVVGVSFAGEYRAVQLLLGPALLVISSARPMLIFVYGRRSDAATHVVVSVGLSAACVLWGGVCLVLPRSVLVLALGKQVDFPRSLLVVTIVLAVAQAVLTATFYRARALGDDSWTTRSRVVQIGVVVVTTAIAAVTRNSDALVLGFAAAAFAPVFLLRQSHGRKEHEAAGSAVLARSAQDAALHDVGSGIGSSGLADREQAHHESGKR